MHCTRKAFREADAEARPSPIWLPRSAHDLWDVRASRVCLPRPVTTTTDGPTTAR
jgi:hypothetical protein